MGTNNNPIIVDSSALVSLINLSDSNHALAVEVASRLSSTNRPILVPSEVFVETVNILGKKFGHSIAIDAGQKILNNDTQFIVVEAEIIHLQSALRLYKRNKQTVSFTDCIVMAIADHVETKDIFGFDKIFRQEGFHLP